MKRYETIAIIDPDLSKEAEAPILERVNDLIPQYGGFLIETDDWGTRKLAYEIKKKVRGHYVRFDFCGDGALIQEMERFFRIDDKVLKFMSVLLDKEADLEVIKADLAAKEAAKEAPAEAPAPVPAATAPVQAEAPVEAETAETEAPAGTAEADDPAEEKKEE
jgi:small subunit ribosomal protein S6